MKRFFELIRRRRHWRKPAYDGQYETISGEVKVHQPSDVNEPNLGGVNLAGSDVAGKAMKVPIDCRLLRLALQFVNARSAGNWTQLIETIVSDSAIIKGNETFEGLAIILHRYSSYNSRVFSIPRSFIIWKAFKLLIVF